MNIYSTCVLHIYVYRCNYMVIYEYVKYVIYECYTYVYECMNEYVKQWCRIKTVGLLLIGYFRIAM